MAALELTDSQKEQLRALREEHRAEMREFKESGEISREKMKALREQFHEAFLDLLTDEQHARLEGREGG